MSFPFRIAFAALIVLAFADSRLQLFAQTDEPTVASSEVQDEAPQDGLTTPPELSADGTPPEPNTGGTLPELDADGRFLSVYSSEGFQWIGGVSQGFGFAWVKFSIILLALFVWLRGMRLCVDDGRNLQLQVDGWGKKLFAIGLAGILTAIVLPAYLVGACVLVATCGVPFWRFLRWRNSQVSERTPRLGWKHLFASPYIRFRAEPDVPFALPSGLGAEGAESTIVLVGKSFTNRVKDEGRDEASRYSGFNLTLALLGHAISKRATDIHIGAKDDQVALRLRVDGELVPLDPLPTEIGLPVINVFKVLSDLSIADKRRSQDGSFRADVDGRRLCFRVASQGTNTGEKLSIRILDPAENFSTFAALGITDQMAKRLTGLLGRHNGLILFAGATGAGKSTTAYAALRYLNSGDRNIVTIEDPIEYSIPSIDQIEVKARTGQTFQDGLRSLLRQDADILLIGEIRDNETARVACQAATTGQLVLSTLHANDSVSAAFRLSDLGVDPYMIASALRGVVSQQLIRKLCTQCRIANRPSDEDLQRLGLADLQGELYHIPEPSANPCLNCNSRGYLGRTGIFELLEVTSPIRDLIRERAGDTAIAAAARENGMIPLWDDGRRLLREGIISPLDFQRIIDEA